MRKAGIDCDDLAARNNQWTFIDPAPIDFPYDYNRDARVNAYDMLIARNNQTDFLSALELITVPPSKAAAADESMFLVPLTGDSVRPAIRLDIDEGKGLAPVEKVSAHDTVLTQVGSLESKDPRTMSGRLAWLYEFEQVSANRQPSEKDNLASEVVDKLLVIDWR